MSTVGRGIVYGQPEGTTVTGIREYPAFSAFGPNPFTASLHLRVPGAFGYTVTNLMGQTVAGGKGRDQALIGGGLLPGIYLLSVTSSGQVQTVKIIKQ
jgi:hypothetical protein